MEDLVKPDIITAYEEACASFRDAFEEILQKYEAFIQECFDQCGFTKDYILIHADEFYLKNAYHDKYCSSSYFWKGKPLFTIYRSNKINNKPKNSHLMYECNDSYWVEFYPGAKNLKNEQ